MKVLFPDVKKPEGGKSYFLHCLYKELEKLGVEIVFDGPHDILFGNIRFHMKHSKAKKILRLDGVIHNTAKPWQAKNAAMKEQADAADVIVCQSQFGYKMVKRFVKCNMSKAVIIGNGAYLDACCVPFHSPYKNVFLAISKWRPHKRLSDIICSFKIASIPNSCLVIVGGMGNSNMQCGEICLVQHNIEYLGHLDDRKIIAGLMKRAAASIHLCWFDCYPNSVVEAIAMKCPVICNNTGGTHEIVRPAGGIVLDLDEPYDYKPVDLYNPPPIDRNKVAEAMWKCVKKRPKINNSHVDIKNMALKYKEVIDALA